MNLKDWAKFGLFLSLMVLAGFGSWTLYVIATSVQQAERVLSQTSAGLTSATDNLNLALSKINRDCGTKDAQGKDLPCGTLADVNRTLATARGTFGQIEIAAYHENKNLTTLDRQEAALFSDTHDTLASLNSTIVSINQTSDGFPPLESKLGLELDALLKTTTSANSLVSSPDVLGTVHNLNTVSYNIGNSTADFQTRFHAILFPPPCKKWGCVWKYAWPVIKDGPALGESIYWTKSLF